MGDSKSDDEINNFFSTNLRTRDDVVNINKKKAINKLKKYRSRFTKKIKKKRKAATKIQQTFKNMKNQRKKAKKKFDDWTIQKVLKLKNTIPGKELYNIIDVTNHNEIDDCLIKCFQKFVVKEKHVKKGKFEIILNPIGREESYDSIDLSRGLSRDLSRDLSREYLNMGDGGESKQSPRRLRKSKKKSKKKSKSKSKPKSKSKSTSKSKPKKSRFILAKSNSPIAISSQKTDYNTSLDNSLSPSLSPSISP